MVGCKYDFILPEVVPPIDNTTPTSFATDIVPIFTAQNCISCNNAQAPVLTASVAYAQLVPNYVNLANPAGSKIYTVPNSGTHYAKISATQATLILKWITEGAKNN